MKYAIKLVTRFTHGKNARAIHCVGINADDDRLVTFTALDYEEAHALAEKIVSALKEHSTDEVELEAA